MVVAEQKSRHGREGVALLAATLFIAVAVLILAALSLRAVYTNNQVTVNTHVKDCFEGAESALSQSLAELDTTQDGNIGLGTWTPPAWGTFVAPDSLPRFDSPGVAPLTVPGMPRVRYMAYLDNWEDDGIDNNGDGNVDGPEEAGFRGVYTIARYDGTPNGVGKEQFIERRIEVIVRAADVNIWRNAIFAGNGQAGGLINGNVTIHGSVHLLGANLLEGAQAIAALGLSGDSLIHNNYTGLSEDLRERVPVLPRTVFNGEDVETLKANLRVRNGIVELSGSSEIGQEDEVGNGTKETMDATYVTDGWGGNSTIHNGDDGQDGDPASVYSDNGWDELYDLGTRVPMPVLSDAWRDPGTGDTRINPATGQNYTHTEYFHSGLTGTPYPGKMTIRTNADFYYNATRPTDSNPANRQATDDYVYFDADSNVMQINGQIEINGDLEIIPGNGNDDENGDGDAHSDDDDDEHGNGDAHSDDDDDEHGDSDAHGDDDDENGNGDAHSDDDDDEHGDSDAHSDDDDEDGDAHSDDDDDEHGDSDAHSDDDDEHGDGDAHSDDDEEDGDGDAHSDDDDDEHGNGDAHSDDDDEHGDGDAHSDDDEHDGDDDSHGGDDAHGNDKTITYTGRGAWLAHGNALLNTDLYTQNSNGTTALSYPVNNCLGIMVDGDMTIGTVSQLTLMGAFYAQGQITSSKQTLVMGTFVSNYFDMGNQVPDIYQVPTLADNLPLGMIGDYPIMMIQRMSWRELGG